MLLISVQEQLWCCMVEVLSQCMIAHPLKLLLLPIPLPLQRYIFQPEYVSLPADEKLALLEEGICPGSTQLQDCSDLKMNFAIDWNLLRPALKMAFLDMQEKHSHILDGLGSL